jgi:hypothetical protein
MMFDNGDVLLPEVRNNKHVLVNKRTQEIKDLPNNKGILSNHLEELPDEIKYKKIINNAPNINTTMKKQNKEKPCSCNCDIYSILFVGDNEKSILICVGCGKNRDDLL